MSLTDEIMKLVSESCRHIRLEMDAFYAQDKVVRLDESDRASRYAYLIRERLQSLESELNDLRLFRGTAHSVVQMPDSDLRRIYQQMCENTRRLYTTKEPVDYMMREIILEAALAERVEFSKKPTDSLTAHSQAIGEYDAYIAAPPRVVAHRDLVNSLIDPTAPGQPFETRDTFRAFIERSSGLPCSNVPDWDGEDGG